MLNKSKSKGINATRKCAHNFVSKSVYNASLKHESTLLNRYAMNNYLTAYC